MKKGYLIFMILLFMVIGYAAMQVRINIEGKTKLSENIDDFKVYMANLKLNGTEIEGINEKKDGYVINIPSKGTLEYDVINDSTEYDVETSVECEETNEQKTWIFDYTGGEQTFVAPGSGTYKLETWGAQGGSFDDNYYGGYGGYSQGIINLNSSKKLYLNIGGTTSNYVGGYNGGGNGDDYISSISTVNKYLGGGGATHIATKTGILSSLENYRNDILIASGGGGGLYYFSLNHFAVGGNAGGYIGGDGNIEYSSCNNVTPINSRGGTQISGGLGNNLLTNYNGSFGQGGNGAVGKLGTGGGGGYYGGGGTYNMGCSSESGAGGSGYIGNALLTEKSMHCYNCEESSEESTKTVSTTCVNETPTVNCAKKGNGYARITGINIELPKTQLTTTTIEAQDKINNKVEIENNGMKCSLKVKKISRTEKKIYNGPTEWTFDYIGGEQIFTAPTTGTYKLEVWGAQGGTSLENGKLSGKGGYGGYSTGNLIIDKNEKIYINVGGRGNDGVIKVPITTGGYNGGGNGLWDNRDDESSGGGGGATHIAYESGLLSSFEKSQSKIIIVSGAGGGSAWNYLGGSGGGVSGNKGIKPEMDDRDSIPGTQTSGYAFGQGGDGSPHAGTPGGGGGAGFYGGTGGIISKLDAIPGSGGSGYIGNTLLSNKAMYCYNCQESSEESTKTISTTCTSATPKENCAKQENGYVRITLISTD